MAFDYERVKHWPIPAVRRAYTRRDTIRFALGIGCGMPGPLCDEEQKFIRDEAGLQALPMMVGVLNEGAMWTQDPATHIDWTQTVHAEESITLHQPLAVENELIAEHRVDEIYDKGPGKGALMYESRLLKLPDGAPVATLSVATFLRGNGGLGGSSAPSPLSRAVPTNRAPDASIEVATPVGEQAIYQLGPEFIASIGIPPLPSGQVMLRGVCAFGIAGRGVSKLCCGMDASRLKKMSLRYAGPTYTGETLVVEVWKQAAGQAAFVVRSLERDVVVLKNGYVEYLA